MLLGVVWGTPDALLGLLGLHIPSVGGHLDQDLRSRALDGSGSGVRRRFGEWIHAWSPPKGHVRGPDPPYTLPFEGLRDFEMHSLVFSTRIFDDHLELEWGLM